MNSNEWNSKSKSLLLFTYLFGLSILFAYLEIQIEGNEGWAKNLPTWRIQYRGFEFTGYHLSMWIFLLILLHFPFFFIPWSLKFEFFILSFYFILSILEDSFWFLLNKDFKGKDDYWRNPKIAGIPYFYFICVFFALLFAILSRFKNWILIVAFASLFVLFSYPFQ